MDNIAAISTGMVASGVAVIRISGSSPLEVAEKVFVPAGKVKVKDFKPNYMYTGDILADGFSDFGMCVYFKAPRSFTGEDTVELHSHGGIAIVEGILKKVLSSGARLAENGEFTKRAFINGKLSLSSAEGIIDMINARTASAVKAGTYLYREKLTAEISAVQDKLTDALSEIDVNIDFPEEDLEEVSTENVKSALSDSVAKLISLLATYKTGRALKDGVRVGIAGKPNTGKSSLLNALLNYDKAIVSPVAGTTRDVVEGSIDINGVRFNFSDTAGIRESGDYVESVGVELSKRVLNESDLILFVMDGGNIDEEDEKIYRAVKDKNTLVVINKTDISDFKDPRADLYVSALTKRNLDELKENIYSKTVGQGLDLSGDFLCEERHYDAVGRALKKLQSALNGIGNVPLDILAIDIKDAWDCLGEISGKTATEEIINNIFSKFCVGK